MKFITFREFVNQNFSSNHGEPYVPTHVFLKNARDVCGLTQLEVAETACVPLKTYQQWERGTRVPPAYSLYFVVYVLAMERGFTFDGSICNSYAGWVSEENAYADWLEHHKKYTPDGDGHW